VTDELAHYAPPGLVSSIAAQLVHIAVDLDFMMINMVAGQEPLLLNRFAGKSGFSQTPAPDGDWVEWLRAWLPTWGKTAKVDLAALQEYRQAVFTEIDCLLASLTDDDLQQEKTFAGIGSTTLLFMFNWGIQDTFIHTGEIASIKGSQGLKGYPF